MARRIWFDEDDLPYYELSCDGCGRRFLSFDDSCYEWRLLCAAAAASGWSAPTAWTGVRHHCPACARDGDLTSPVGG